MNRGTARITVHFTSITRMLLGKQTGVAWRDANTDQEEGVVPARGAAGLEQGGGQGEDWWDSSRLLKASLWGLPMK